jgi:hypothetical protein
MAFSAGVTTDRLFFHPIFNIVLENFEAQAMFIVYSTIFLLSTINRSGNSSIISIKEPIDKYVCTLIYFSFGFSMIHMLSRSNYFIVISHGKIGIFRSMNHYRRIDFFFSINLTLLYVYIYTCIRSMFCFFFTLMCSQ